MKNIDSFPLEMQCIFMKKINYAVEAQKIIDEVKESGKRPTLLLHACCAPCSTHTLNVLVPYFDVTIYYANSNLFPSSEYQKRRDEIDEFVKEYNKRNNTDIKIVFPTYNHELYMSDLRELANEKEGGKRCERCYKKRLEESFIYASENHFDFVTTTLTISSKKNSQVINEIAKDLQTRYPNVRYFFSDFKKNNADVDVKKMSQEYGLYKQNYCGCEYSIRDK